MLAHIHPPGTNPNRVNDNTKHHHEFEADGIILTDRLKIDDFEKLDELIGPKLYIFERNVDKTLTQQKVQKNMNKDVKKQNQEDIHEEKLQDNTEHKQKDSSEENQTFFRRRV